MKYQDITVFKRNGDGWNVLTFDKAYAVRINAVGGENGGRYNKDILTARIFSPKARLIAPEDKIAEGKDYSYPPESALTVTEVADNFGIKSGHIRVTAR